MLIVPIIIDDLIHSKGNAASGSSLLTLPLGGGAVLDHLSTLIRGVTSEPITVVPSFEADQQYVDRMSAWSATGVNVAAMSDVSSRAQELEISDVMLIIDPRYWPAHGFDFKNVRSWLQRYRGATHVIAVGADAEGTREQVECDSQGRVRRVQRFYNSINWPEVAGQTVMFSVVPAKSMAGVSFRGLSDVRAALAAKGMLTRDLPVSTDLIDPGTEAGYLRLHERVVREASIEGKAPFGYESRSPGVWVGRNSRIDASARLVGSVIVQADASIGAGATVIGPTVLGRGSVIEAGATVVQSVVAPSVRVGEQVTIRHCVVASDLMSPDDERCRQVESQSVLTSPLSEFVWSDGMEDSSSSAGARRELHARIKRVIDASLAALALLVLSPFLLVVAILVKLDSKGPVFFAHKREGKGGREFPCIKFRTMVANAHDLQRELYKANEVDGPQFKLQHDPRMTRLGALLRATNIDELPQLINVLRGDMSLVGPRPSPFRENQICVPWRRARLSVPPGITGLWQLCRADDRSRGDFHEWINYDIMYVRHFSLWLDCRILVTTVATFGGRWSVPITWFIPGRGDGKEPHPDAIAA